MNLKKLNESDNPLFNRKKVNFELEFTGATPKKSDILKDVSTSLKTKEELIFIKHVYQKYGSNKAEVIANVYNKVEDLKSFERIKENKKTEEKKEAPKAETKPEEKPAEVKEEPKVEEKKDDKEESKE